MAPRNELEPRDAVTRGGIMNFLSSVQASKEQDRYGREEACLEHRTQMLKIAHPWSKAAWLFVKRHLTPSQAPTREYQERGRRRSKAILCRDEEFEKEGWTAR